MSPSSLPLSAKKIARCRNIASKIGGQVAKLIAANSTVGTERAVLRLLGVNDALQKDDLLFPVSNHLVDQLKESERLEEGALFWVANALLSTGDSVEKLQERVLKE